MIGKLKYNFLKKYGHLRPGSYDINSPRYDEEPDNYFKWKTNRKMSVSNNKFELRLAKSKLKEIDQILNANKFNFSSKEFLYFATEAIRYRELSKFIFTKNLSDFLFNIKTIGKDLIISTDDLSYSNIKLFKNF